MSRLFSGRGEGGWLQRTGALLQWLCGIGFHSCTTVNDNHDIIKKKIFKIKYQMKISETYIFNPKYTLPIGAVRNMPPGKRQDLAVSQGLDGDGALL